ncbi:MAG: DnaD and phage-associated domain [Oscillospiraceae bacterium]|nr:DnaD and phage-associated domain [Oscillospiraceae bacterium]
MAYALNPVLWRRMFPVPAQVIERHIKLCSGVSLKCLLLLLNAPDDCCDAQSISAKLGISAAEVSDALNYWLENGILQQDDKICAPSPAKAEPATKPRPAPVVKPSLPITSAIPTTNATSNSRPHFPREESVALIEHDRTLQGLVQELQSILGKPLTSADLDVLLALYSFYGLSAHYILTLVHYCVTIDKSSMGYAEKVAASWIADGIDDSALDHHIDILMHKRTNEGKLKTAFGINDRSLTQREKDYISTWCDTLGMDIDTIRYAYEITVERTGKLAFGYLNKILHSWNEKGIRTVAQAKAESNPARKSTAVSQNTEKSDFDRKMLEQFMKE